MNNGVDAFQLRRVDFPLFGVPHDLAANIPDRPPHGADHAAAGVLQLGHEPRAD
jgi:hypothetical protein